MDVREKAPSKKRLIDAKSFAEHLERMARTAYPNLFPGLFEAAEYAKDFPTVDAVPVVRCRECKHWKPTGSQDESPFSDMEYIGYCKFTKCCSRESDFCSYGEKEGAD